MVTNEPLNHNKKLIWRILFMDLVSQAVFPHEVESGNQSKQIIPFSHENEICEISHSASCSLISICM